MASLTATTVAVRSRWRCTIRRPYPVRERREGGLSMAAEDNRSAGVATRTTHPWVISRQGAPRFGILEVDVALGTEWPAYLETAQMAEELGFDSYWTSDHPLMLADCWTALTALATATKRLWLGSLTRCIYYGSP